jgi:hypothetical protein
MAATNSQLATIGNWEAVRVATIKELLGEAFSIRSVPRLYNEKQL